MRSLISAGMKTAWAVTARHCQQLPLFPRTKGKIIVTNPHVIGIAINARNVTKAAIRMLQRPISRSGIQVDSVLPLTMAPQLELQTTSGSKPTYKPVKIALISRAITPYGSVFRYTGILPGLTNVSSKHPYSFRY